MYSFLESSLVRERAASCRLVSMKLKKNAQFFVRHEIDFRDATAFEKCFAMFTPKESSLPDRSTAQFAFLLNTITITPEAVYNLEIRCHPKTTNFEQIKAVPLAVCSWQVVISSEWGMRNFLHPLHPFLYQDENVFRFFFAAEPLTHFPSPLVALFSHTFFFHFFALNYGKSWSKREDLRKIDVQLRMHRCEAKRTSTSLEQERWFHFELF